MQLKTINQISGEIELLTGLRIGAGNEEMHIGGMDNPVIKHPYTQEPYIPGSSLKGKMRSLLEWRAGIVGVCGGKPVSIRHIEELDGAQKREAERIIRLFGISGDAGDAAEKYGPTRLAFWDCALTEEHRQFVRDNNYLYTEAKSENSINRISGVAESPRQTERVPAGSRFAFRLNLKVLDDTEADLLELVKAGLKMLTLDGIGGSGSRGYGKIRFNGLTLNGQGFDLPEKLF
jgi:CRISPR-associated protein Csm3